MCLQQVTTLPLIVTSMLDWPKYQGKKKRNGKSGKNKENFY